MRILDTVDKAMILWAKPFDKEAMHKLAILLKWYLRRNATAML